ncbi:hypothetical protein [Catenuloplanes indicus]|uniref:Uncharacterized protein n=1 Tax=Catenuloplanes indicus TaxID=137267 RepID=A0AAE3VUW9_9ACTN|nr:hypothetical protein [Catenuloplanes indicus]MDQ0364266.1 hypothetical protein [Catenuloplanes indicus]
MSYEPWRLPMIDAVRCWPCRAVPADDHQAGTAVAVCATLRTGVLKATGWGDLPGAILLVRVPLPLPLAAEVARNGTVRPLPRRRLLGW